MADAAPSTKSTKRLVRKGEILPTLTLANGDGRRRVPGPGQQATLLVFVHPGRCSPCAGYLDEVGGAVDELREWATAVLAVSPDGRADDDRPFPVLGDDDGAARRRLGIGDDEAAVLLADRWGEVIEVATFGSDHSFPLPSQLVESAKILDLSCGECNVPGPEWREE